MHYHTVPSPRPKRVTRTFYDVFSCDYVEPSRQVRRQLERRMNKMPVFVLVKDGAFKTRRTRVDV